MTKKILAGAGIAVAAAVLATALIAGARTTPQTPPQVLQVGRDGHVLLRGTIASITTGVLTVNSWGGPWTVNVGSGTQVFPAAAGNDITQFKSGDFVGVVGTASTSSNWTIDATIVRDWTYRQALNQERQSNIRSVREAMRGETPRNYQGTASGINGTSFTLTAADGTAYTVDVASDAKVLNRNWLTLLSFSSIQNGDTVRVWGPNASGTITAEVVRDISIPATSTVQ